MDTRTTRNLTVGPPVQLAAVESILSGLEETDSEIYLPDIPSGERRAAREFILDVMEDLQRVLREVGVRQFIATPTALMRGPKGEDGLVERLSPRQRLTLAAQLPLCEYHSTEVDVDPFLYATAEGKGYAAALDDLLLIGLWQLQLDMWRCCAALLKDGILSMEGGMLVWHSSEDRVSI